MILSNEEIGNEIKKMEKEADLIRDNITSICWWMRGSISYTEAWQLSERDRKSINKLIKDNLETTKKTGVQLI